MSLSKIPARTDYVDEVYKALLDAITTGALAPGERVTQDELAEKLNVSRSPILQALRVQAKPRENRQAQSVDAGCGQAAQ